MAMLRRAFISGAMGSAASAAGWAMAQDPASPAAGVRSVLSVGSDGLGYLGAKVALDALIDPSIDRAQTLSAVETLAERARSLAGEDPDDMRKLAAARTLIYQPGPWNENRAFAYDHSDPYGRDIRNKLLATYLRTRLGNCVSMPILFLILAERLGANVALASAPLHVFVRYIERGAREVNLEATSGALPARDAWYRQNLPMTDEAVASGLYLRTLSRVEGVALMATTVMESLIAQERYEEAIAVGDVILECAPRDVETIVRRGSIYGRLLQREFIDLFQAPDRIPPSLRPRFEMLAHLNREAFERAEALGWREPPRDS